MSEVRWRGSYITLHEDGSVVWDHCARCGHSLSDPVSMAEGIGPDCREYAEHYPQLGPAEEVRRIWRELALAKDRQRYRMRQRYQQQMAELRAQQATFERSRVTEDGFRVDADTGEVLGPVVGWAHMTEELRGRLVGRLPRDGKTRAADRRR